MPVRAVSNRGGNIIGRFPSFKLGRMVDFESLIERDFIYLLDFEREVMWFEEQPLTLEYEQQGKVRCYTPDFQVVRQGQPMLVECKPKKAVNLAKNQEKFQAGQTWCAARGWKFQVVTDEELRGGYRLSNVKFLTQFAHYSLDPELINRIRICLTALSEPVTMAEAMTRVAPDQPHSVKIPIYHLAFHHQLHLPLDEAPLSLNSPVSWGGGQYERATI